MEIDCVEYVTSCERIFQSQRMYYTLEKEFEWRKWMKEIPALKFPSHWNVKIIPPFAPAMVRFSVHLDCMKEECVSVYLDCYQTLGASKKPYWEIYPYENDTYRCYIKNTDELLEQIQVALDCLVKKRQK